MIRWNRQGGCVLVSNEMRRVIRNEMELFFGSSVHRRGGFPYLPTGLCGVHPRACSSIEVCGGGEMGTMTNGQL